jgi:gamma-glutamyltranspeptidase/glutathione hydrolase
MFDARRQVGDPAYSRIALDQILSTERLRFWRESIDPARATPSRLLPLTGTLHTTHIAVVDAKGNAASMTISLSGDFGCGWVAGDTGILLNGAMNDFRATIAPVEGETTPPLPPNAAEAKKRPATTAAPSILFFDGRPRIVIGAAGGDAIPHIILAILLRYATFNESLADAVAAPRIFQTEDADQLACEKGRWPDERLEALRALGHGVELRESIGEVNAILIDKSGIVAVADPRGQGATGGN